MQTKTKQEEWMVLTDLITILADERSNEQPYAVFEEQVPPLGGPPPHQHPDEEIFYVVAGEFEFILNDMEQPFRVLPGSVVHVPSNALHTFKNIGGTPGKMVVILSPGDLLDYFRVIGDPLTADSDRPDLNTAPDFTKLDIGKAFAHADQHSIRFVVPDMIPPGE